MYALSFSCSTHQCVAPIRAGSENTLQDTLNEMTATPAPRLRTDAAAAAAAAAAASEAGAVLRPGWSNRGILYLADMKIFDIREDGVPEITFEVGLPELVESPASSI
jgi:hypothetical protein